MAGAEWALFAAVLALAVLVLVGFVLGARVLRRLTTAPPAVAAADDPGFTAEKDRQEQALTALRTAAGEATAAVEQAKTAAAAART
ncbi:ribonuclease Y, partial [Micromonospora sp. CPCC 205371]|nr:ribonuclease Y [Micromonospora sp. CPCC 205371]